MKKFDQKGMSPVVGLVVILVVVGAIGFTAFNLIDSGNDSTTNNVTNTSNSEAPAAAEISAADLRVSLNNALREHVELAGVTLRNVYTESPDADAAVAALDKNSEEVAGLVGTVYGDEAGDQFLSLWRDHITFFANYTVAAREGDQAGMDQALEDLAGYGAEASAFFEAANPNLPATAVKPLLEEHRNLVIDTINLIGAGDFNAAYLKLAEATDQVGTIGDALAGGIVAQFPDRFAGDVNAAGTDLRVSLNNALREHVNIAGVALRNVFTESPDADAAVAALDKNSEEVAGLVGAVYGDEAGASFLSLWRSHIGFFANYTVGAREGDQAAMDQALEDLAGYGVEASAFFEGANPNLPATAVKPLLEMHRDHVIDTVNLIGAGDFAQAYIMLGEAADQVGEVADALAGGISAQFPDKF